MDGVGIIFIFDLNTALKLGSGEDAKLFKHCNGGIRYQGRDRIHHGREVGKPPFLRFLHPFPGIAVSVENDSLMLCQISPDECVEGLFKILCAFQFITGIRESLRCNRIEDNVRSRNGIPGSHHAEFKLIAGKCEGARAIAVSRVFGKIRKRARSCRQFPAPQGAGCLTGPDQLHDQILQLVPEKNGDDGRRSFIRAQAMVISRIRSGFPEQVSMLVYCFQDAGQHQQKLIVLVRRLARVEQVDPVIGLQGPVIMLAGAVDPCEGLFMEQAAHVMPGSHPFEGLHHKMVVVHRQGRILIDHRQLMLRRSDLVVLCLGRNAEAPQLLVHILHEGRDPCPERSIIVVVQLLPLRRHRAKQRTARVNQILPPVEGLLVNEEIFLLRADIRPHLPGACISKQAQQTKGLLVDGIHGTKERGLEVQRFPVVGTECGGDAERRACRVLAHKGRGSHVPCRVAPRLEGCAKAAGGK